jgi:putative ABC transport system permease protein
VRSIAISPELFDAMGLALIEGRTFTSAEMQDPASEVAVINQELARRLWPGDSPLNRRLGFLTASSIRWLRVVGVAPNVHYEEVGEDTDQSRLNVYVPYARAGSRQMTMLVRAAAAPQSVITAMRDELGRLSPTFAVIGPTTMSEVRQRTTWEQEFFGELMAGFAAGALLLACLGIYALMSYTVGRRGREIGVRLALGARPGDVIGMLLRESVGIAGIGLGVGLIVSVGVARALASGLYGVTVSPGLFASMAAPLAAVLFVATWLPARRAARVDPTTALRNE